MTIRSNGKVSFRGKDDGVAFEVNDLNLYVQVIRFLLWNSCLFQNHASN